jgi:transposase
MRPLPAHRYELAEWKHAKVNIDYCVTFDHRHYSVPYTLVGEAVEIRATARVVEILHKGVRVASHARHYGPKGSASIADEHRPRAHREYGKWPPERVVAWAETVGPRVGELAGAIMSRRTHPETGYRACLGVIRLADRFGRERVDAACARAVAIGSPSFKTVQTILKNGLDRAPLHDPPARATLEHSNIRGASYFDKEEESDSRRDHSETRRHEDARDGVDAARDDRLATHRRPIH